MDDNTGAANAVMGDSDSPTVLPQTDVPDDVLEEERKFARYSKTAEFKRLQRFMEDRIAFYQRFLPSGTRVEGDPNDPRGLQVKPPNGDLTANWIASCIIIKEFENVLGTYKDAVEAVKDAR